MAWYEKLAVVVGMVLFMECFAWATHKYVMHGWGWGWHRSHHEPHEGAFEKNDLYAITFAVIVVTLFVVGCAGSPCGGRRWASPSMAVSTPSSTT